MNLIQVGPNLWVNGDKIVAVKGDRVIMQGGKEFTIEDGSHLFPPPPKTTKATRASK